MKTLKKKEFKRCDICKEDILREKFKRHLFWLGGVQATLCRGMSLAKRRAYEAQSQRRLAKLKAQARILGYTEPGEIESFLRGHGFGCDVLPKKKKKKKKKEKTI